MALINCPECGKEISDKAASCPNCGNPMNLQGSTVAASKQTDTIENKDILKCPKCNTSEFEVTECKLSGEHKGKSVNVIQCSNPQCRHIVGIVDNSILSVFGQVADILEKRLDKIEKSIQSSR